MTETCVPLTHQLWRSPGDRSPEGLVEGSLGWGVPVGSGIKGSAGTLWLLLDSGHLGSLGMGSPFLCTLVVGTILKAP